MKPFYLPQIYKILSSVLVALYAFWFSAISYSESASEESEWTQMHINKTYMDVRTGPGKGYPVFHTLERAESIYVIKSRTDWFKIQTQDRYQQIEGWVHRNDLHGSKLDDGTFADLAHPDFDSLMDNRIYWSTATGMLNGAQSLELSLGYRLSEYLTAEARFGQSTGDFSDIQYGYLKIASEFNSLWRITPYFALGAGAINTSPNTKLVQSEERVDPSMLAGVGMRAYLTRNFFMHLEFNQHLVLTDRETNEDLNQWLFGLSVSF